MGAGLMGYNRQIKRTREIYNNTVSTINRWEGREREGEKDSDTTRWVTEMEESKRKSQKGGSERTSKM